MNKALLLLIVLLCCTTLMNAQTLTEAEVTAKMNEAFALRKAKKTAEALDAFLVVGKNTKQQRTASEHQVYVCSQTMACTCYGTLKRYEEAYQLAKEMMQGNLSEEERKEAGGLYALYGYKLAQSYLNKDKRQYAQARAILEEVAPYADNDKLKAYVTSGIPYCWYLEGASHHLSQEYRQAFTCYSHALKGYRQLGKSNQVTTVLMHMAEVEGALTDVAGAERTFKEALSLAKQSNQTNAHLQILKELWKIRNSMGDVRQAQIYAASMDSLVETTSDIKTKHNYYNQKGDEAKALGQYAMAEQWYLRGKELAERADTDALPANKHLSYSNLRNLYAAMGRYDHALMYARKAIEAFQAYTSQNDANYHMPYMALADIYRRMGDKEKCYKSLDKLFESTSRTANPKVLYLPYVFRGNCRVAFKDYQSALNDFKKADELLATQYAQTDDSRATLLALKGNVEHQMGHYAESEALYRKYAECMQTLYGTNSLEAIQALIYLANAEGFAGKVEEGCQDYAAAERQLKAMMRQRIPYMDHAEREGLWSPLSLLFTKMTPFALEAKQLQTAFTKHCYNALVLSKSFLLESERSMYDVIKRKGTAKDMHDYLVLTGMKNQVKAWEKDYQAHADSILSVSQKVNHMEHLLAGRCLGYSNSTAFMDVDYDAVKQTLGPNEVLIDFTDYESASQGRKYAAYILNKTDEYPLLKSLFAERQVDSLGIVRPDMYYDQDYAPEMLRLVWDPLKSHVAEGSTIYYVPSQLLFQLSLESLPLADGTLLGSHYRFVRLSSARELARMKSKPRNTEAHTAVLYGGLQYDLEQTDMAEEAKKYDLADLLAMRGDMVRGDSVFHELKGSKEEVMKISDILKGKKWHVKLLMGKEGTEESFLAMHGKSPQVLQMATHGFYYTPSRAEAVDYLKGYTDAMSLSGVVMSGGNAAWLGKPLPKGVLGGILTANDIARLDLSQTDMVVLSACKSGQGKATAEGLYGLQRAFKKAGVGTLVMSLWNVSDKTASEFMVTFYERLTDSRNAWNKRKAFEETKELMRKKYPDPFHWAAFVMSE